MHALLALLPGGDDLAARAAPRRPQLLGELAANERQPVDAVGGRRERGSHAAARRRHAAAERRQLVDRVVHEQAEPGEEDEQQDDGDVAGNGGGQPARGGGIEAHVGRGTRAPSAEPRIDRGQAGAGLRGATVEAAGNGSAGSHGSGGGKRVCGEPRC